MKLSDALMYAIYKNNNRMTSAELLNYIKRLKHYDMVEVNDDGVSFRLSDKAIARLRDIGLL